MHNKNSVLLLAGWLFFSAPALAQNFTVNDPTDDVDVAPGDGVCATFTATCTLRAAVQEANASPGADTIILPAGTYTLTKGALGEDDGAEGDLDVAEDLIIEGAGRDTTFIDGNKTDRILDVKENVSLEIRGLTVQNGYLPDDLGFGGGIEIGSGGTLIVTSARLTGNQAKEGGAVQCWYGSRVSFNDSLVDANIATSDYNSSGFGAGGGLHGGRCAVSVRGSQFTGNTGYAEGGAIYMDGALFVADSVFSGNSSVGYSAGTGAIYLGYGSNTVIVRTSFEGNTTDRDGGAVTSHAPIFIADTTFSGNSAGGGCGSFSLRNAHLENVTSVGNSAAKTTTGYGAGGCLYESTVQNSVFRDNVMNGAPQASGGGLAGSALVIRNSAFINNQAIVTGTAYSEGGGLSISGPSLIENTTISGNTATSKGGGVAVGGYYEVVFSNVTMTGNRTTKDTAANLLAYKNSYQSPKVTLANTILADPGTGVNCSGSDIFTDGGNISSDASCTSFGAYDNQSTDALLGTFDTSHFVFPLGAGSPAIGYGSSVTAGCPLSDQRGYLRSGTCDTGAYELGATQPSQSIVGISESFMKVQEWDGFATFTLTRTGSSEGEVRAVVTTESDTARAVTDYMDYTHVQQVVTWADGDMAPKTVAIPINNDQKPEDDDELTFRLVAVSENATIDAAHQEGRVRIIDDDGNYGYLTLDTSTYSKWENRGELTVYVERLYYSYKDVSVEYRTVDGTAVAGADYTGVSGVLTWEDGDSEPKPITIPILDDASVEGNETFQIELFNNSRAHFNGSKTGTITVLDDESSAIFDFSSANYSFAENAGYATVTVVRSGKLDVAASVYVITTDSADTATYAEDYDAIGKSVAFAAGETKKTVSIPLIDDALVEGAEFFTVKFWSVTDGALGEITKATVTIEDVEGSAAPVPTPDSEPGTTPTSSGGGGGGGGGGFVLQLLLALFVWRRVVSKRGAARVRILETNRCTPACRAR